MDGFMKISEEKEIPAGKMKEYKVNGKLVTVANSGGIFHAFEGLCTHAECSLAGGYLSGTTLTCYCHGSQYDITTGKVLAPPATINLKIYEVKTENGEIYVKSE